MNSKSKLMLAVFIIELIFLSPAPLLAEGSKDSSSPAPELRFDNLGIEQGLSNSRGETIVQDENGFMWFGTYDGLNRYDGYEFSVYKNNRDDKNSLSNNTVIALFKDRDGMIWIGTSGGGLEKFDPTTEKFTHYQHDPDNPNSLSSNVIPENAIYQDHAGNIWIATKSNGLNRLDPVTQNFTRYLHNPDDPGSISSDKPRGFYEDARTGLLWVGTRDAGLNSFNPETEQFTRYQHDLDNPNSLSGNNITSIVGEGSKRIWITTRKDGLNAFDLQSNTFTRFPILPDDPDVESLNDLNIAFQDSSGILWIGTNGGGVVRFDPDQQLFSRYKKDISNPDSLGSDFIRSIYEDKSGLIYIGNSGGGISKLNPRPPKFAHYKPEPNNPNSLRDGFVLSVYEDRSGTLWVGNDRVLNRFDRKTGQFTFYKNDPDNPHSISVGSVMATHEDEHGILWFGTFFGGLNRFDPKTEQFKAYLHDPKNPDSLSNDIVLSLHQDKSGIFWLGTRGGGLNRFDPNTERFKSYQQNPDDPQSLSENDVYVVYEDREGMLWLGTRNGGLNRFDPKTEQIKRYEHDPADPKSVGGNIVSSIYEDEAKTLWVGTSGGLSKLDRNTDTFSHYTEKQGLPNNGIQGILADDSGNLWLSTNSGLSRFNPQTETFRNYDVLDGLQSNEFNRFGVYFKSKSGETFFGGINGFNAFYPDQIKDNPFIPPIVLTEFQLFNETVSIGGDSPLQNPINQTDSLTLSYSQNIFSLGFSALDFTTPKKNRYRYRLEGFESDWTKASSKRRFVTYTNLDPGDYTFRVQGSNGDGIWNNEGVALNITITPPWWQTWWFRLLMVLLFVILVSSVFFWQRRSAKFRERLLKDKVAERTHKLSELNAQLETSNQEKSIFLTDLQQQTAELHRVNEEQKSFSYSVSHDLRQPLRAINGFSEALFEDYKELLDDTARDYLHRIRRASKKMAELIECLLSLSRLSSQEMMKEKIYLDQIAESATENLSDREHRKNVELIIHQGLEAEGDRKMLFVVLLNLFSNAWKYTQNKDQTKIEFGVNIEEGKQVFYLRDNGEGFDMNYSNNLFKEFQRLHDARDFDGIGIGLATVKRIIKRHGGNIWAEGKVGEGATFFFTLD